MACLMVRKRETSPISRAHVRAVMGPTVTLRQEIAAQTVSDLAGIDRVVLLLRRCNRPQHQGVSYLDLLRMRKQMVVDPAAEDRRFHGNRSRLGKCLDPAVQFAPCRSDLAVLKHLASRILDTVTDRLLVYIQSDIVHIRHEEPPWWFSESASPLSSAYATPRAPQ